MQESPVLENIAIQEPPPEIRDMLDRQAMEELDKDIESSPLSTPDILHIIAKCNVYGHTFMCADTGHNYQKSEDEALTIRYSPNTKSILTMCPFCNIEHTIIQLP